MDQPSSRPRASTHPWIPRLLSVLPLLLAGGGCGLIRAPAPTLTPPMPVQAPLRKQVLQGHMPFGSIGWVNDELVVFHGSPVGSKAETQALYLWDLKTEPREMLKRSYNSCVSKGTIRASQLRDTGQIKSFLLSGPDFALRLQKSNPAPRLSSFDPSSCSWIATPMLLQDRKWEALRKSEGFLDFGPRDGTPSLQSVEHITTDLKSRQDTGIRMEWPMLPQAMRATHDGSYLIYDLNQSPADERHWIETNNRTIWRLNRQMQGTPLNVPAGPWVGLGSGTISFLPSRPGVLITSNNFARNRSAGGAGLYLLHPNKPVERLERGLVEDAVVSPNGCRVAYGFRPRLDTGLPEGGPRLVVLDLCGAITTDKR